MQQKTNTIMTVQFYYTPAFRAVTVDIAGYINQLVLSVNTGYANSQIPLTLQVYCMEEAVGFVETNDAGGMLAAFRDWKGNVQRTKNSADLAMLVLSGPRGGACGVAYINGYRTGWTVSWVGKGCLTFTTQHEV